MHPLSAEFARVDDYVQLMKVRMGERLSPELELPAELATQPVPPLLLQPLVENAIKHGLEPNLNGGRLIVSAGRERDRLVLRVRDTGAGLQVRGRRRDAFWRPAGPRATGHALRRPRDTGAGRSRRCRWRHDRHRARSALLGLSPST